jgi:hypothetical protein
MTKGRMDALRLIHVFDEMANAMIGISEILMVWQILLLFDDGDHTLCTGVLASAIGGFGVLLMGRGWGRSVGQQQTNPKSAQPPTGPSGHSLMSKSGWLR